VDVLQAVAVVPLPYHLETITSALRAWYAFTTLATTPTIQILAALHKPSALSLPMEQLLARSVPAELLARPDIQSILLALLAF
jgi:hypothetical protein